MYVLAYLTECDTCTHNLLDDMDYLDMNISDVQDGLQTVSIGVFAMRRLDNVNKTVIELQVCRCTRWSTDCVYRCVCHEEAG